MPHRSQPHIANKSFRSPSAVPLNPLTFMRARSWLNVAKPAEELVKRSAPPLPIWEGLNAHAAAARIRLTTIHQRSCS